MRTLTSLCAVLLCTLLHPWNLKAQDSQVSTGDNGGQLGHPGKKGAKKGRQTVAGIGPIGVFHPDSKGNGMPHGQHSDYKDHYYVQEKDKTPFCINSVNITPTLANGMPGSSQVSLLGKSWQLSITDNSGHTISLIWPNDNNNSEIRIDPDLGNNNVWSTSGSVAHHPTDITLNGSSDVNSAVLSINGQPYQNYSSPSGKVTFTVHYCGTQGCGKDQSGKNNCQ